MPDIRSSREAAGPNRIESGLDTETPTQTIMGTNHQELLFLLQKTVEVIASDHFFPRAG